MERRRFLKMGLAGISSIALLADKAWALKYYPNTSDKKWAVLYSTWCGTSRDAGVWISEGMGGIADVFDLRENPDLRGFDHIILGSSIRGFKINPSMQNYIEENKGWLKDKIRGFYAVCGNMRRPPGPEQVDMYINKQLMAISGVSNVPGKVFPGRMTSSLLDKEAYAMMAQYNMLDNYDNLKRDECLAFGKEILDSMK